jgi:hypothetical protein
MNGFVVGHPRSGTQLLSAILNASQSQPRCTHELLCHLNRRIVGEATRYYLGKSSGRIIAGLLRHYDQQAVGIDCNWKLSWVLPPLLAAYPRARLLHLVRDPAATIRSCFNLDYYGTLLESGRMERQRFRDYWLKWMPAVRRPDWSTLDAFEKNCAFWEETQHLIEAHSGSAAAYLRIRLEELSNPDRVLELFRFFSLIPPSAETLAAVLAARFNEKADEKLAVVQSGGEVLPEAPQWSASRRAAFERICGRRAALLGYQNKV